MKKRSPNSSRLLPLIVLALILAAYALLFFVDEGLFQISIAKFLVLITQISPFLLVVFIIMFINFWFIKLETVKKYLGDHSGPGGYVVAILAGIISVGPVYVWYPLLKDLKAHGMSPRLIAVFIYNRSIKLHLLPIMILYFGWRFTTTLTLLTILFSLVMGFFIDKFALENGAE